jgi:hypothetical protein
MWAMTRDGQLPRCDVCGAVLDEAFALMEPLHREPRQEPPRTSFSWGQQVGRWLSDTIVAPRRAQRPQGRRRRRRR